MFNMKHIMSHAWEIKRSSRKTFCTCLKLAWAEAKGQKVYTFDLENARAGISAYLAKLVKAVKDEHDTHKLEILKAALTAKIDRMGVAVLDGKTVGLCKYAVRNAL